MKKTLSYRLSQQDLLSLYGLANPGEIINEFGQQRCASAPTIYRLYQDFGLHNPQRGQDILKKMMFAELLNDEDVFEAEHRRLQETKEKIWSQIEEFEEIWRI